MAAASDSRNRLATVGLAALATATVAVSWLALSQFRGVAAPADSPAPSVAPTSTTPSPTAIPVDPIPSPSRKPSPQPTASAPAPQPGSLAAFAAAFAADGAAVTIFGDGSGNEESEWVHRWATEHLAKRHAVSYAAWNAKTSTFPDPAPLSNEGASLTVWNASMRSPVLSREPGRVARAWQRSDAVLLSYGHRKHAGEIESALDAILEAVRGQAADVPVAVVLQNPDPSASADQQKATVAAVAGWAKAHALPTIDVYSAFPTRQRDRDKLVEEDGSPNDEGSRLFASAIAEALAG
ncbi:hypothetical protein BW730_16510 [Tessaracoccus aquimaris]|uniref:SGNH hydrolase-type esterase domain-containing protein n=1 Tax=Tessaracoccus aquimaris TaxID=1332264 RepID=A0A1Q2CS04_9ACTN|nr:hypothetical protein [Tessaracoccus aquimaris]AQP48855.1 hypothetical protein BW730_16510 [Tessaracoccus aquimaris]